MAVETPTHTAGRLLAVLDPKSLLLTQFSDSEEPNLLQLTTDSFIMERGPRYKAYADLRESRLRMKRMMNSPPPLPPKDQDSVANSLTPPRKQGKFQSHGSFPATPPSRQKGSSVLTQSVPDFSSVLRKENRKPALPPVVEKSATPPAKSASRFYDITARLRGSKSSVSAEKKSGGLLTARKSYANMDELKKLSVTAGNAIDGENRGGGRTTGNRGGGRNTVLGYKQYY